jgi:hypothetical protein
MQRVLRLMMTRKQSTKRVDDMADGMARAALDQRLHRMLALHASQPAPQHRHFALLSNPIQIAPNS